MPRVNVTMIGGKNIFKHHVTIIKELAERQIKEIADETVRVIQQKISERIQRDGSTGNLANSFTAVKIDGGWGVGDIDFLNKQAPYWYWQNYGIAQSGRRTPPRSWGAFTSGNPAPSSAGGKSRWSGQESAIYVINPVKPIEAKNYIAATAAEINQIVASVVGRIKI